MQIYKAPLKDIRFVLETFGYDKVQAMKGFEDYDLDTVMALIEESGKFCANEMLALNHSGDQEGITYDPETKSITTPEGFKKLYADYVKSGIAGITQPIEYGGGGAPHPVAIALSEMATACNKSFSMCPGLGHGLIEALLHYGTGAQKKYFLPKFVSGEWTGTMCLTEPQCGTDLGLISTKAVPPLSMGNLFMEDDHYLLTGTKIWITFGEHDLTDNIIHLVLARLPDAPEGIRGISAFLVPKINADGSRNPIYCGGIEHKMGIHASPTCVMNLEEARGYLVGEPHKGMRTMFVMMNFARLTVGVEGYALGEIAYQTALEYCKDRRQGRSLNPERNDANAKADNILVHPDVRRQLLNVKCTNEGMRALALWVSGHIDVALHHEDETMRQESDDMVALLTPIIKGFCTERGFENVSECMQVCGGSGYTTEWSIEQYLRDVRIAMIYEGTNHVQALDLVGRKLAKDMGRLYKGFAKEVHRFIKANKENPEMTVGGVRYVDEFTTPLEGALKVLNETTMALGMRGMSDKEEAAAAASKYLTLFGLTTLAYLWARMALAAQGREGTFYKNKVKTARYYFSHILPETKGLVEVINAGKQNIMDFEVDDF